MSSPASSPTPWSVRALILCQALEAVVFLAAGAFVLARFSDGLLTGITLLLVGLLAAWCAWSLRGGSLGAHKSMAFFQTLMLITGFSFITALPGAGLGFILLGALTLVAGFMPSTRVWFESHGL